MSQPERFPESAFHSRLFALWRDLVGPTTEAPDSALHGAFMSALSVLVGRDATLPWGAKGLPPVVNVAVLGATSKGRKSTAVEDAVEIVVRPLMPRGAMRGEPDPMEIVVGSGSGEGFAEAIADRTWTVPGKQGDEPADPKVQTGRRGLFVVHEFGGMLEKVKRDQAGNLLDFILCAFDARAAWTHRTRRNSLTMTDAVGVFLVATTYEWLQKNLTNTTVMAGLTNRFIWLTGDRKAPLYRRLVIDTQRIEAFQAEVSAALAAVQGHSFELAPEADAHHKERYELDFYAIPSSELAGASTARLDQLALRVAMLFAVGDSTHVISLDHIRAAWEVCDFSAAVVTRLVEKLEESSLRDAEARVLDHARTLAEGDGLFTRRDVRQRVKGRGGMPAQTFNIIWDNLIAAGDIPQDGDTNKFRVVST